MSDLPLYIVMFNLANDNHSAVKERCLGNGFLDHVVVNGKKRTLPDATLCLRAQSPVAAVTEFKRIAREAIPDGLIIKVVIACPLLPGYMSGASSMFTFLLPPSGALWEGEVTPG